MPKPIQLQTLGFEGKPNKPHGRVPFRRTEYFELTCKHNTLTLLHHHEKYPTGVKTLEGMLITRNKYFRAQKATHISCQSSLIYYSKPKPLCFAILYTFTFSLSKAIKDACFGYFFEIYFFMGLFCI